MCKLGLKSTGRKLGSREVIDHLGGGKWQERSCQAGKSDKISVNADEIDAPRSSAVGLALHTHGVSPFIMVSTSALKVTPANTPARVMPTKSTTAPPADSSSNAKGGANSKGVTNPADISSPHELTAFVRLTPIHICPSLMLSYIG